jgi:hypothetical protein
MAIIVQEEKQTGVGLLYILGWFIFGIIILIGIYYVFFKKPEIYEAAISLKGNENINRVVEIGSNTNFDSIIENPVFKSLKNYIDIPQNISSGKDNPFSN